MRKFVAAVAVMISAVGFSQFTTAPKEINDLKWMVGSWTSEGTMSVQGESAPYTAEWVVTMEGAFIKGVTTTKMMGIEMVETSYLFYDAEKKEYVMHVYTNFANLPRTQRGKIENGVLVLVSEPWDVAGQKVVGRASLKKVSDEEANYKLDFQTPEGWAVVSDSAFKRMKG